MLPERAVNALNWMLKEDSSAIYYGSSGSTSTCPLKPMCGDDEHITIHLVGHCDGVQWFKNFESKRTAKPILAKIIGFSKKGSQKVLVHQAPVFIVGIFYGRGCPNKEVMRRLFAEWHDMNAKRKDRPSRPYYIQFDYWACDAVQRCEFKGCAFWGGYEGCERCISQGEWILGVIVHELATYPKRIDSKWHEYVQRRENEKKDLKVSNFNFFNFLILLSKVIFKFYFY